MAIDTGVKELVYVAAPYTHSNPNIVQSRMGALERHLAELSAKGEVSFSPLLMHYCLGKGVELPGDYGFWRNHCLTLLSKSDILDVLMLPGWNASEGVADEIGFAKAKGITVRFTCPDCDTIESLQKQLQGG